MSRASRGGRRWDDDYHSRLARRHGYRSRAAFKLIDIQRRSGLLRPGMVVLDLGAAPGGFSQVAREETGVSGLVIALDREPIASLPGVATLQADIDDPGVLAALAGLLGGRLVDVLLCDAAPPLSGVAVVDAAACDALVARALELAEALCHPGGQLLIKLFQGSGGDARVRALRERCQRLRLFRASASRPSSREIYAHAIGLCRQSAPRAHSMI